MVNVKGLMNQAKPLISPSKSPDLMSTKSDFKPHKHDSSRYLQVLVDGMIYGV